MGHAAVAVVGVRGLILVDGKKNEMTVVKLNSDFLAGTKNNRSQT